MPSLYNGIPLPSDGRAIELKNGRFEVPENPIIPFIEGDGTGRDIWKASKTVFDAAVQKAYGGKRHIAWYEIFAGEKAFNKFHDWLPEESVDAIRDLRVAIKGPLTTPIGGGIRALEHHNDSEEALYAQSPGLKLVVPSGPRTARGLLASAIRDPDPVVFLEPKRIYRAVREDVPDRVVVDDPYRCKRSFERLAERR